MRSQVARTLTADEAAAQVLEELESADPRNPLTLADHLTRVGLTDPYRRALALRLLRSRLKPDGSHFHLTKARRWAYERERWTSELGLEKGKTRVPFDPETDATRAVDEAVGSSTYLPDVARDAIQGIRGVLSVRANRKLDETSSTVLSESVEDLIHELDVQGRLIEEKNARIQQAEHHNEQLRQTNASLLALMERLTGGPGLAGGLTVGSSSREEEKGDARSKTN